MGSLLWNSLWLIAVDPHRGGSISLRPMIQGQQTANDLKILSVELHHVYILRQLPLHHHDPFDRLLIAQAKAEQMRLVSADSQFAPYLVDVLW